MTKLLIFQEYPYVGSGAIFSANVQAHPQPGVDDENQK